ncbi:MAG: tyrosine-type recombinase/integrase [Candidatus Heimdallarchaeota archaeon]
MTKSLPLKDDYEEYLEAKNRSPETFKCYCARLVNLPLLALSNLPKDESTGRAEAFKSARKELMKALKNPSDRKNVIAAFRSYVRFLKAHDKINAVEEHYFLDTHRPVKRRGRDNSNGSKWSIPKDQWKDVIRCAPHKVARMGIWLGFNFGLRRGEILHLRVKDIDFRNQVIHIRLQSKKDRVNQEVWKPKYNVCRRIPFGKKQERLLKKWIDERPELEHPYMLWAPRRRGYDVPVSKKPVSNSAFRDWCRKATLPSFPGKLHPHILRYSFATHRHRAGMDLKLLSLLLGHANVTVTSDYLVIDENQALAEARAQMDD